MTWMDHALVLAFAAVGPVWGYFSYQKHKQRVRAGIPGARLATYAQGIVEQWLLATAVVALWIHQDRDWTTIGLVAPASAGGMLALAAAVLGGALLFLQAAIVARRPDAQTQVRDTLRPFVEMVPVQRSDLTGFVAVSITAGVCEELLFRGVLGWYLAGFLGVWGAQAAALVLFAAGHLYLGPQGAIRALLAGAAFTGLYLWSGSLVPSILLHALVDTSSGWMAYEALRDRGVEATAPA